MLACLATLVLLVPAPPALPVSAQELGGLPAPWPPSAHDADASVGRPPDGGAVPLTRTVGFDGVLHVFVEDQGVRLALQPEGDVSDAERAAAHLRLEVEPGQEVRLLVSAPAGGEAPVTVRYRAAPETDATRAAAAAVGATRAAAQADLDAGAAENARTRLADALRSLDDVPGAQWSERVAEACWPAGFLAYQAGDPAAAARWWTRTLRHRVRVLPPDDEEALRAWSSVGTTLWLAGDPLGGESCLRRALAGFQRTLPPDDRLTLMTEMNLGSIRRELGDLQQAAVLLEGVLEGFERSLPPGDKLRLDAMHNLAALREDMGDRAGARLLQEQVLAGYEASLPDDDPDLQRARGNLAHTLEELGELQPARELLERVLAVRETHLSPDNPELLSARQNLANVLGDLGHHERAVALLREDLAACEDALPPGNLLSLRVRFDLSQELANVGEPDEAAELQRLVVAGFEHALPRDHPDRLLAREALARTELERGHAQKARALVAGLVAGLTERAERCRFSAPREAREALTADRGLLGACLLLGDAPADLARQVFELVETRRSVATAAPALARLAREDPQVDRLARQAAQARAELADLVAVGGEAPEDLASGLGALTEQRDRAEGALRRALAEHGRDSQPLSTAAIARRLPSGTAAVAYLRYSPAELDADGGRVVVGPDRMLAHVLRAGSEPVRVELGRAAGLEALVERWRASLGRPLPGQVALAEPPVVAKGDGPAALAPRGRRLTGSTDRGDEPEAGRALRRALLDPVLEAAGEGVDTLWVLPDDLVHLVPLDALPLDGGADGAGRARVADRYAVSWGTSFSDLLRERAPVEGPPTLLALGDPAYGAEVEDAPLGGAALATATPPMGGAVGGAAVARTSPPAGEAPRDGGPTTGFPPLAQTRLEVEAVAAAFGRAFDREAVVLEGAAATKRALWEGAGGARYLHLATHGWFAPEAIPSASDAGGPRGPAPHRPGLAARVAGFAPMTLCGLALAGADRGPDALGRVPGILTAEELCALDLEDCRLAVLSACETRVGLRRAGQGIASLEAALRVAGARSTVTTLWQVDDEAARRLMERFYDHLWSDGLPTVQALRQAKQELREAGSPVRDWAAWVPSGP